MVAGAIIGAAVIGGGAALLAGGEQADAANRTADLQAEATRLSVAEQRRQFDLFRGDLAPYRDIGVSALNEYGRLYGIGRETVTPAQISQRFNESDEINFGIVNGRFVPMSSRRGLQLSTADVGSWSPELRTSVIGELGLAGDEGLLSTEEMQAARDRFQETPGYQFRFDEGIRALDRSASATGRLRGGGYTRELTRYGQGVASGEFENYANRLAGIAGMGQGATTTTGTLGVQTGANIGNTLTAGAQNQGAAIMAAGTARASGYAGVGNAASGAAQNYMLWNLLR